MPSFKIIGRKYIEAVEQYLGRIPDDGKTREISIVLRREKRTIPQNRLYRLWLALIEHETGNHADDLHEFFKRRFLGEKEVIVGEEKTSVAISTTSLDTAQFTDFLTRLEAWVISELSIILPHPEDAYWDDFESKYGYL